MKDIKQIWKRLKCVRAIFVGTVLVAFISSFGGAFQAYFTNKLVNDIYSHNLSRMKYSALILFIVIVVSFIVYSLIGWGTKKVAEGLGKSIKIDSFKNYLNLEFSCYENMASGEIVSNIVNNSQGVAVGLGEGLISIFSNLCSFGVSCAYLILINPSLTVVIVFISLILFLLGLVISILQRKYSQLTQQNLNELSSEIKESMDGMYDIKQLGVTEYFSKKFSEVNDRLFTSQSKLAFSNFLAIFANSIMNNIVLFIVILVGGNAIMRNNMSLGDLIAYIPLIPYIFLPISTIIENVSSLQKALGAMELIQKLEDLPRENISYGSELKGNSIDIKAHDINYSYRGRSSVLRNVNFVIPNNSFTAIIGSSGAGKSTIASLLIGLVKVQSGRLLINEQDINSYKIESVRRKIAFVPQQPVIYTGTIRENILMGNERIDDSQIQEALRLSRLKDVINGLTDGLETLLGEGGITLSKGQSQRLCIARTILRDASILIFDEPTASLDEENKSDVMKGLEKLRGNKTIIIITHNIETIQEVDNIIVVDSGTIIEKGKHEELVKKQGVYFNMLRKREHFEVSNEG